MGKGLRWAIGTPDGLRSTAWLLVGNKKGDLYVSVRSLGGITKASFHRDGRCQVGFTDAYRETAGARFGAAESRHWETWRLPDEPMVRVLQIFVPRTDFRAFVDRNSSPVTWLPTPPDGAVAAVSIFVSTGIADTSLPAGASLVGQVRASTRTAWVVYAHTPVDAAIGRMIGAARARIPPGPGAGKWPAGTRTAIWESRPDHDRHVLELACD